MCSLPEHCFVRGQDALYKPTDFHKTQLQQPASACSFAHMYKTGQLDSWCLCLESFSVLASLLEPHEPLHLFGFYFDLEH